MGRAGNIRVHDENNWKKRPAGRPCRPLFEIDLHTASESEWKERIREKSDIVPRVECEDLRLTILDFYRDLSSDLLWQTNQCWDSHKFVFTT